MTEIVWKFVAGSEGRAASMVIEEEGWKLSHCVTEGFAVLEIPEGPGETISVSIGEEGLCVFGEAAHQGGFAHSGASVSIPLPILFGLVELQRKGVEVF